MIGFVGPFGDSNYGDYAMFVNDAYDINIKDICVFTYNVELFKKIQKRYLYSYNICYCKLEVDYQWQETFSNTYHVEYDTVPYTSFEIINMVKNCYEVREYMGKIDKLIVCGGGYFNHIWSAKHRKAKLLSILGTILIAVEQKVKVVFLGNTFGPFNDSSNMFAEFFACLKNESIAVRDNLLSVSELRRIGYNKKIAMVPDDLYFLNDNLREKTSDFTDKKYIVWECYPSMSDLSENIDLIRIFVQSIKKTYKSDVIFLPLDSNYGGERQAKYLKENVNDIIVFDSDESFIPIETINTIVSGAQVVIAQRYHLFLTALSQNVPCISVLKNIQGDIRYYHCKVKGLLDQVFFNQRYCESTFMTFDIWETLQFVQENMEDIITVQRKLFNYRKIEAEKEMKNRREEYIGSISHFQSEDQ